MGKRPCKATSNPGALPGSLPFLRRQIANASYSFVFSTWILVVTGNHNLNWSNQPQQLAAPACHRLLT